MSRAIRHQCRRPSGRRGDATAAGATHASLHRRENERPRHLGGGNSCAYGINTAGQVVGSSGTVTTDCLAFLYSGGTMKDLGTLGGPSACAYAINDAGQVVGVSLNSSGVQHALSSTPAARG